MATFILSLRDCGRRSLGVGMGVLRNGVAISHIGGGAGIGCSWFCCGLLFLTVNIEFDCQAIDHGGINVQAFGAFAVFVGGLEAEFDGSFGLGEAEWAGRCRVFFIHETIRK